MKTAIEAVSEADDSTALPPCDSRFHYVPPWQGATLAALADEILPSVAAIATRYSGVGWTNDLVTVDETATLVAAVQEPRQSREHGTVSPVRPRVRDLPAQHRDLVPQHQDLRILATSLRASSASQPNTRTMNT